MNVTYRGRRAVVVTRRTVPTPSGREVEMALLRFPRGGEQWVFAADLGVREPKPEGPSGFVAP